MTDISFVLSAKNSLSEAASVRAKGMQVMRMHKKKRFIDCCILLFLKWEFTG